MIKQIVRIVAAVSLFGLTSACVYRINIQQGNYLNQSAVNQVKPGMTMSQVRYLLGTPLVANLFDKSRWDYVYYLKRGYNRHVDERRVTVFFDGNKVVKIDKPSDALAAAQEKTLAGVKNGRVY
ncbi:MAG: outer membrane protein assembly factor BamE [Gammaproteobacteria bacterium]|nr:outer membrane protein assembly factor BamE [Gammaproteobacteria bacterium]MDE2348275.1 outer membrane protein assembly factor BamE [Gammaproteobacteria bacterium]